MTNEEGYAKVKYKYDTDMRLIKESYYGMDSKFCQLKGGYSSISKEYDSNDCVQKIEYLNNRGELIFNTELGYAYACYERYWEGTGEVIFETYYDRKHNPLMLSELGYAGKEQIFDENGNLEQEAYYGQDGMPVIRTDYKVARIIYGYSEDGNLIQELYKDTNGQSVKRADTGYEEIRWIYNDGRLQKEEYYEYKNQVSKPAIDRTSGISVIEYKYNSDGKKRKNVIKINRDNSVCAVIWDVQYKDIPMTLTAAISWLKAIMIRMKSRYCERTRDMRR